MGVTATTASLASWYERNRDDPDSDIAPHFPTFFEVVRDTRAHTILELGVRDGHSTSAWLMALAESGHRGTLSSIDRDPSALPFRVGWRFLCADDLSALAREWAPDVLDVLFIDTDHAYGHTLDELDVYGARVRPGGMIVCHDTENEDPASRGEAIDEQPPFPVRVAIDEWTQAHGLSWTNDTRSWGLGLIPV